MKVRNRLPKVFVGHPFRQRFPVKKFRKFFKDLPFNVVYANTDIETKHLLQILKGHINEADYSIFDLSGWNPNVTLELGLSEGIGRKSNKKYYILLNTRRALEVPADVRGIQRLEYSRYDYSIEKGLGDCLITILKSEAWVKNIIASLKRKLNDEIRLEKSVYLSLRIVAHMRDFEKLTPDNLKSLTRGTRLREEIRNRILVCLQELGFIRKDPRSNVYFKRSSLFV